MAISEVYNCDCNTFMADCKDKQFDLAIVDPPYGIKADRQHTEGWGWISRKSNGWDKKIPPPIYFTELQRISKNRIICGGNYFTDHLLQSSGWVVWDKGQRDFSLADGELIYTSFNVALRIFNYSRGKFSSEREGFHPTEKPIALYKWLLKNYAKPGDKIFDSHMGSQSSRIACYEGGFDFIGCELDKEYFDAGCKRFEIYKQQLKINF